MVLTPETKAVRTVAKLAFMLIKALVNLSYINRLGKATYVAPAMINSIILELVNRDKVDKYKTVDAIIMKIRAQILLVAMQMTTGVRISSDIKNNMIALAVRLINGPE